VTALASKSGAVGDDEDDDAAVSYSDPRDRRRAKHARGSSSKRRSVEEAERVNVVAAIEGERSSNMDDDLVIDQPPAGRGTRSSTDTPAAAVASIFADGGDE
jgi:hypothetical protein